jgi:uncharacterized protein (DUF488 family)
VEVWTIGHSNHPGETFVGLLKQHGITTLVDVRSKPVSRFAQFSRDNLIKLMEGNGLKYLYGGNVLGGMCGHKVGSKLFQSKMGRILELASDGRRVAMMCSEGKPRECHRAGKLTAYLHRTHPNVKTTHILADGTTVDAKEYEPQVLAEIRWHEFLPWAPDLFHPN